MGAIPPTLKMKRIGETFDPSAFDTLRDIVHGNIRTIKALEESGLLPIGTEYSRNPVPYPAAWTERTSAREHWFQELLGIMERSNMIFLDPDNGIESERYRVTKKGSNKSVRMDEIERLARSGRTLIVYHHHTRTRGGHLNELQHHARRFRELGVKRVDALRARAYSPRAFFIINADAEVRSLAAAFAQKWVPHVTWHENLM